ncbi:glycosyltransferase [Flavobacterium artemisiae]|uniref:Glycosyltransferase n=1 Tax=Flavobacterium artemisiae TaxID=2126556 RepID=A0ABW4HK23_9FLAO
MNSDKSKQKISVLTFCHNQEKNIENHLKQLSFADEIIVIDQNSTDRSVDIAAKNGAFVLKLENNAKIAQEKLAVFKAKNDWILLTDCTYQFSNLLTDEILDKISSANNRTQFYTKETLFFFGKKIKYGDIYTKKKLLIFNKERYNDSNNSSLCDQDDTSKTSIVLKNRIDSYAYNSFDEYNTNLGFLRKTEAQVLFNKKIKPNFYHFLFKPFFVFVNQYFIKLGFIDGKEGCILASINAFSILKRYLILWLLYRDMD